jgi:uncharacterized membrane protein
MIRFRTPLNLLILLIGVAATLAGFLMIPADAILPVHFNIYGQPDNSMPRNFALLQMPLVVLAIWVIFWAIQRFGNPERQAASASMLNVALPAVTGLMVLIQVLIVLMGTGHDVNFVQAILVGLALMEIALGNVMPKSQPNHWAGIRIPSTLNNPAIWQAVHRLTGGLMVIGGVVLLAAALLVTVGPWLFAVVFGCWFVPLGIGIFYAHRLGRQATR